MGNGIHASTGLTMIATLVILSYIYRAGAGSVTGRLITSGQTNSLELTLDGELVNIALVRVTGLLSPEFSIIVRDGGKVHVNDTSPFPVCLYRGVGDHHGQDLHLAVSLCGEEASGNLVIDDQNFVIKITNRAKREVKLDKKEDVDELEIKVNKWTT